MSYQPKPVATTPVVVVVAAPPSPVILNPEPELPTAAPAFVLPEAHVAADIQVQSKLAEPAKTPVVTAKQAPAKRNPTAQAGAPVAASKLAASKPVASVAEPAKPARKRPTQRRG
jgi:hypothetical protein